MPEVRPTSIKHLLQNVQDGNNPLKTISTFANTFASSVSKIKKKPCAIGVNEKVPIVFTASVLHGNRPQTNPVESNSAIILLAICLAGEVNIAF